MKLYRLHKSTRDGSSLGYEFFGSKKAVEKAARQWGDSDHTTEIVVIEVKRTKSGILDALNREASHADNG